MKKLIVLLTVLIATATHAVGPSVNYRILTWEAVEPLDEIAGFWLYYRDESSVFSDERRFPIAANTAMVDLSTFDIPRGSWFLAMSAINAQGDESQLSTEVIVWNNNPPKAPKVKGILKFNVEFEIKEQTLEFPVDLE